ncbi:MAG: ABC transporter ATP-binding protein [Oscillospiraceae bacterium]
MIKIDNLTVCYPDGTKAVDSLSFEAADGESIALVGANGAGKSTLFMTLVGVLPISSGAVTVDGTDLNKNTINEIRKKIGIVFQNPDDQLFMPRIYDDVAFGLRNSGMEESDIEKRVHHALDHFNIMHLAERSPLKLSGGEKRVCELATVLAMRPSEFLFDEPSSFLDPRARRNTIELMKSIKQTKIIATHDLRLAVDTCDRVLVLKKGRLFASGTPGEILFDIELMNASGLEAIGLDN